MSWVTGASDADLAARQQAAQQAMAKTQALAKANDENGIGAIGGVLGGVIGAYFGGPQGALQGAQIGAKIGSGAADLAHNDTQGAQQGLVGGAQGWQSFKSTPSMEQAQVPTKNLQPGTTYNSDTGLFEPTKR